MFSKDLKREKLKYERERKRYKGKRTKERNRKTESARVGARVSWWKERKKEKAADKDRDGKTEIEKTRERK